MFEVNCEKVSVSQLREDCHKQIILQMAADLLREVGSYTVLVGLKNDNSPFVYEFSPRMNDILGSEYEFEE